MTTTVVPGAQREVSATIAKETGSPADLREFLAVLERAGELRRVPVETDWRFEIGAVSRLVTERRGPAPLFEKVKDYPRQQIAAVLLGPSKHMLHARVALALGFDPRTPTLELIEGVRRRLKNPIAPRRLERAKAPCKEVVLRGKEINLLGFPVPWIKETLDGGRYIGTWDMIIAKDPDSGWVNWATYRCMVKDNDHFTILLQPAAQHGGAILQKYEAIGKPMPIALVVGADPASHLASIASLEYGVSEAEAAGGLRGSAVELVKCETNDLEVPANAEIVIEAEVLPGERVDEGPFGEYTGHSAQRGQTPVARVTCITHRRDPISTMANMGKPWDDSAIPGAVTSAALAKNRLEAHGIEINSIYYYVPAIAVISLRPRAGLQKQVIATLLSGERKVMEGMVFVDEDVDVTNVEDVWWAICSRMNPSNYEVVRGVPANPLCPSLTPLERECHESSLWVMDATIPYHWSQQYREDHTKVSDFTHGWSEETKRKILARWKDYGYGDV